jgi:hypothetical protein
MLKTYAYGFVRVTSLLMDMAEALEGFEPANRPLSKALTKDISTRLKLAFTICGDLELKASSLRIQRLQKVPSDWRTDKLASALLEIRQTIEDELRGITFQLVSVNKANYYDQAIFGQLVDDKFPEASDDIREAGNCYAFERYPAVVYHCMGIVQCGLTRLAAELNYAVDIYVDDWNEVIQQIESAIGRKRKTILGNDPNRAEKSAWAQAEPVYSEIVSEIRAIKNAWRNPGAHYRHRRQYNERDAKKILDKIGDLMRTLAEHLP